jgi:hypothetical protein
VRESALGVPSSRRGLWIAAVAAGVVVLVVAVLFVRARAPSDDPPGVPIPSSSAARPGAGSADTPSNVPVPAGTKIIAVGCIGNGGQVEVSSDGTNWQHLDGMPCMNGVAYYDGAWFG